MHISCQISLIFHCFLLDLVDAHFAIAGNPVTSIPIGMQTTYAIIHIRIFRITMPSAIGLSLLSALHTNFVDAYIEARCMRIMIA